MKYVVIGVTALALSACSAQQQQNLPAIISQAQQATHQACAFIPTAETVANILAAGNVAVKTGSEIATAICAALAPHTLGVMAVVQKTPAKVGNVEIHGWSTK